MDNNELNNKIKNILNEDQLWEMANIDQQDTGLAVMVYVSPKNANHGPRIKFMNSYSNGYDSKLVLPMTIDDKPIIPISFNRKIKQRDINDIKNWIILNKDILLDYWYSKITTKQMINSIKSIGDNGNK